jgi:hypothetical protein
MKKHLVAVGIASTVGLAGVAGVGMASAATDTTNPQDGLISAIASKFNLEKDEVKKVFDEQRAANEKEREAKVNEELAQLVKDGKLTQAQVDTLKAKKAELQKEREANREEVKDKTRDEMKAKMDAKHTELENWASAQGIDKEYLKYVFGGGHGMGGPGGPR